MHQERLLAPRFAQMLVILVVSVQLTLIMVAIFLHRTVRYILALPEGLLVLILITREIIAVASYKKQ